MKAKKLFSAVLAVVIAFGACLALASCNGNEEAPTTAPSATEKQGPTDVSFTPNSTKPAKAPEVVEEDLSRVNEAATEAGGDGSFVTEVADMKFVYPEYFASGNSYVTIEKIVVDDIGFNSKADAYVTFKITARGADDETVKLSYIGYDENGEITRRSQITIDLFGHQIGDTVEERINFKRETVKLEITEFKEIEE